MVDKGFRDILIGGAILMSFGLGLWSAELIITRHDEAELKACREASAAKQDAYELNTRAWAAVDGLKDDPQGVGMVRRLRELKEETGE